MTKFGGNSYGSIMFYFQPVLWFLFSKLWNIERISSFDAKGCRQQVQEDKKSTCTHKCCQQLSIAAAFCVLFVAGLPVGNLPKVLPTQSKASTKATVILSRI